MKHFNNDGCNKQPDFDKGILNYEPDEDYDKSMTLHYESDSDDWYEGIKHFEDD